MEAKKKEGTSMGAANAEYNDDFLVALAELILKQEERAVIDVPERQMQMMSAYQIIQEIVSGKDLKIECKIGDRFRSMGAISVSGKDLLIVNPERFQKAAFLASNFEIYPKVDGTIQFNLTFLGLRRAEVY